MEFLNLFINQLQNPVLAFLLIGMVVSLLNSRLEVPEAIYQFCVFVLLVKIGMQGGMAIRESDLTDMIIPAIFSTLLGVSIVVIGSAILSSLPGVKRDDALATVGLFGAVSGSTLAATMMILSEEEIFYEAWVVALYPFMDIPALVLAIVLANMYMNKKKGNTDVTKTKVAIWPIVQESLQGSALTALLIGLTLGWITRPEAVYDGFYDLLFGGLLTILMLSMGIEAAKRIKEIFKVAHWYIIFAIFGPIVHGLMGFGLGYIAHLLVGLSPGGVILLAIMAASNSDVSGPPTIRAGIPTANPSIYIGTSTGLGTVVAIAICIPLFLALGKVVFDI